MRFLMAKTPEQRAAVDLDTRYTQEYLEQHIGVKTRRQVLYQGYVEGISATGMQSNHGFDGQLCESNKELGSKGWLKVLLQLKKSHLCLKKMGKLRCGGLMAMLKPQYPKKILIASR
ncbi:hypothetical protein Lser_V15G27247 [Lactuca serriola]